MRRFLLLPALAAAIAVPAATSAATPRSGLRGTVRTSAPPVCLQDLPCDGLARGVTLVFSRRSRVVARATTRDDGTYRVLLRPARYHVRIAGNGDTQLRPSAVAVPTGRVARVDFFFGTRIPAP